MKKLLSVLLFFSFTFLSAQELYVKTFGTNKEKSILFLHGGPGYNCASFEITTAQELANNGYFVIVYDRRGEGRSEDKNAKFTFDETYQDIQSILNRFEIKKINLIGHSFGGIIATQFADKFPKMVNAVLLVSAPVSLQESFQTIISKCKAIYTEKKDAVNLNYIGMLEKMDSKSLEFSTYCFGHAMQNGFYTPKVFSDDAKTIYSDFRKNPDAKLASKMTVQGPQGFWNNEKYTSIDLTPTIQKLVKKKLKIYGLYGKEDGLYSENQINSLQKLIGATNLVYLDQCSHSVYIDQQKIFIEKINTWLK
jgi:proline iminopeptidase